MSIPLPYGEGAIIASNLSGLVDQTHVPSGTTLLVSVQVPTLEESASSKLKNRRIKQVYWVKPVSRVILPTNNIVVARACA
ncbi:hypothetical protein [Scytonema sp. PCC 10023]|uniref:hypothetical protein n=1 Tax=Scytonema sp. PCC 10023 TaxID=1680591 RepID=UPI0039C71DDA